MFRVERRIFPGFTNVPSREGDIYWIRQYSVREGDITQRVILI